MAVAAPVAAQPSTKNYDIPMQPLGSALSVYAEQSGIDVIFTPDAVSGKRSTELRGRFAPQTALDMLLRGSGLVARRSASGSLVVAAGNGVGGPAAEDERAALDEAADPIVVTASRIEKAGFDAPTPTTVLGAVELRQGARQSVQQVLNDSPQVRATVTPTTTIGGTAAGAAPVDLRGLGPQRTLTLVNGRRFVGSNNLNYVPLGLVERVEIVTGGASAAYGSDAVAGVVNIILKEKLEGLTVGGQTGISSRGDGMRFGLDASFGTSFGDGNGHILLAAEYLKEKGIEDRNSRPNLGSAAIVRLNPTDPADRRSILTRDVNIANVAAAGLITSGLFAGQVFNDDGTLRPFRGGALVANSNPLKMIGGEDGIDLFDTLAVSAPLERLTGYGRAAYDLGAVTIWADGTYGRSRSNYRNFIPNVGVPTSITIQATNPFLSASIRNALANAPGGPQSSFTLGKYFNGPFQWYYDVTRTQIEGAIGFETDLGGTWKASGHYSHGEVETKARLGNVIRSARYANALNAVSSGGQIVCAINADSSTANDDPACRPLNLFGRNAPSAEALAYVTGVQSQDTINKLDSAAVEIQGDVFSLWAGPVIVAVGGEVRFEQQIQTIGDLNRVGGFSLPIFSTTVGGGFNVKEGFGEIALPLLNAEGIAKIDLNGAARYSDYSRSGGIWSWKYGGTVHLFDTLLLRGTRSRDIRAPSVSELFSTQSINIGVLTDLDNPDARQAANPAYNRNPATVTTISGGNVGLMPEISKTKTLGLTFSPRFIPGLNLSVDYFDISISGAITNLSGTNLTLACRNGSAAACGRITRDSTGTVTQVLTNSQNIAEFKTKGIDFEASYAVPMSAINDAIPGSLRVRALATYVKDFIFDTGVSRVDSAGDVGDSTGSSLPKWRGTFSLTYQGDDFGLDARVRYMGGGAYNHLNTDLVNNHINSRTYVDLGAQFKVLDKLTLSLNVNNLFDRDPPIIAGSSPFFDVIGRYFTAGARVRF